MKFFFPFYVLLLFLIFLEGCSQVSVIDGIVLSNNGAVQNPVVRAFPDYNSLVTQQNSVISIPGKKDGQFILKVKPGKYYLTATGSDKDRQFFSFHGLNPITVTKEDQWVPFFAIPDKQAVCEDGYQGVGGHVYYQGEPAANGGISVYSIEDEPFRGMGLLTNTITTDGEYWFDLEPGQYVLVARKRLSQAGIGPIKQGDLFCYSSANPVEVLPARSCQVDLYCYPRNDLEAFLDKSAADPRGKNEQNRRSLSLVNVPAQESTTIPASLPKQPATIKGAVTDLDGKPYEGLFISAYPAEDLNLFQMYIVRFKTKYMARTDRRGKYNLDLESGSYYLVAREHVGEAPVALEYYGLYEGSVNHNIIVRPGETRGDADITVVPVMP